MVQRALRPVPALLATVLLVLAPVVQVPASATDQTWSTRQVVASSEFPYYAPRALDVGADGAFYAPAITEYAGGNLATGHVVRFPGDGSRSNTDWSWTFDLSAPGWAPTGYPLALAHDAAGNVYAAAMVSTPPVPSRGWRLAVLKLPRGAQQWQELPFDRDLVYQGPGSTTGGSPRLAVTPDGDVYLTQVEGAAGVLYLPSGAQHSSLIPFPGYAGAADGFTHQVDLVSASTGAVYLIGIDPTSQAGLWSLAPGASTWQLVRHLTYTNGTHAADLGFDSIGSFVLAIDRADHLYTMVHTREGPDPAGGWSVARLPLDDSDLLPLAVVSERPVDMVGTADGVAYLTSGVYEVHPSAPQNADPVATDGERQVKGGRTSGLVLSASDPDGDPLTYAVVGGPDHGALAGTAPDLTYTPDPGYSGPDEVAFSVDDGHGGSASATVAITVTDAVSGTSSVSQQVAPGQSVSTGSEPNGDQPTTSAVESPNAGSITISEGTVAPAPGGYAVLGSGFHVEAPLASAEDPLRLRFGLDLAALPAGQSADDVTVFRDGVAIVPCADDSGTATPDPCVLDRESHDGTLTITVLSSHASEWLLAVPKRSTTTVLTAPAGAVYGNPVTLAATVSGSGGADPTGSVVFRDVSSGPAVVLGTGPVGVGGAASLTGLNLPVGTHRFTAAYVGDPSSAASLSAPVQVVISKAPVVVTTTSTSGLLSLLTFKVAYSSVVRSRVTGAPLAGISVTTRINGGSASAGCTAVTNASGVASCSSGPVQIALGSPYTATSTATASYLPGSGSGKVSLF
ncbi:Ig-like domain-containing protein [Marmoricola sp. RAF53]|uniref:Ig-like domain-containing protein n=1 Tax=Marmoricola sp. RAF53 TaxID=3233059 RepID=UPI003F9E25FB